MKKGGNKKNMNLSIKEKRSANFKITRVGNILIRGIWY